MPPPFLNPGVSIEEQSGGGRTISGVATSIAAFVGWAPQGPTDRAVAILSFTDYERTFGEIDSRSYLGYALRHFFDNGGRDAYVLRIANPGDTAGTLECGNQKFEANSPGAWSRFYGVEVKASEGRFTVTVVRFARIDAGEPIVSGEALERSPPSVVEVFPNLASDPDDPRFAVKIINNDRLGSLYVRVASAATPANDGPRPFRPGTDTVPEAREAINTNQWKQLVLKAAEKDGVLDRIDLFNLLCVPGLTDTTALGTLTAFCERRRAFLIADSVRAAQPSSLELGPGVGGLKENGALYFPWLNVPDPLDQGRLSDFPPSGSIAGLYARTDATRGVWKAPAGTGATLVGVHGPKIPLTDQQISLLNGKGVNCIRSLPGHGTIAWGARTLDGDDEVGSEWKYVPVRRVALFVEESLYRGTQWVVFEPNDEPLWAQIRLSVGAFLHDLFRQGAFQGRTADEAYFVNCNRNTTTQSDIDRGIVNIVVGFAPLKPAEFVFIEFAQVAGQIDP